MDYNGGSGGGFFDLEICTARANCQRVLGVSDLAPILPWLRRLRSLWYHPLVPVTAIWTVIYLVSQALWRLRGESGWTLRYDPRWPKWLLWLLLVNWIGKNPLLVAFGIEL